MKRCPYCGKEYSDDATACAIDQTPFENVLPQIAHVKRPTFAIFSEHKIPVSLAVISYVWFLPAACCFAIVAFLIFLLVTFIGFDAGGSVMFMCIPGLVVGTFFLCLSRGLRRGSPRWRNCTLLFIWCGFLAVAFSIGRYLLMGRLPADETITEFWLSCVSALAWQAWQYRVLTRPDVRALFYE